MPQAGYVDVDAAIAVHAAISDVHHTPAGGDLSLWRTLKVGNYYKPLICTNSVSGGSSAITANRLYAIAFPIPRDMSFDRAGIREMSGISGNLRLGLYNDNGCYPSTLHTDFGTVDLTAAGVKNITIALSLAAGLYWLAFVADAAATLAYQDYVAGVLGGFTDPRNNNSVLYYAFSYAALPTPFATGATPTTRMILAHMRLASLD